MRPIASSTHDRDPDQLSCNLCQILNGIPNYTDLLWLRTVRGRDYLVCREHGGGHRG